MIFIFQACVNCYLDTKTIIFKSIIYQHCNSVMINILTNIKGFSKSH